MVLVLRHSVESNTITWCMAVCFVVFMSRELGSQMPLSDEKLTFVSYFPLRPYLHENEFSAK